MNRQLENRKVQLTELLDCALDKGVAACGDLTLSVAGVDLVFVGLKVLLSSVDAVQRTAAGPSLFPKSLFPGKSPSYPAPEPGDLSRVSPHGFRSRHGETRAPEKETEKGIAAFPDIGMEGMEETKPERGLAKLVLTVVELVRKLMEKQAIRRVEGGGLSDEEIERLGNTFAMLEERMEELKRVFGLEGEELELDLGPLGRLT